MTRWSARTAGDGRVWPPFTNPVRFARKEGCDDGSTHEHIRRHDGQRDGQQAGDGVGRRDEARPRTRGGKLTRVTDNTLVMTNRAGMESTHKLSPDTKVTSQGRARNASDLKPGMVVQVTSKPGDRTIAIGVEFAPCS